MSFERFELIGKIIICILRQAFFGITYASIQYDHQNTSLLNA